MLIHDTIIKCAVKSVEKGSYTGIPRHIMVCKVFNTSSIENEQHFLLECPAYRLLRKDFILKLEKVGKNVPTHICFNRKYLYGLLHRKNNIIVKLMFKFIRSLLNMRETLI